MGKTNSLKSKPDGEDLGSEALSINTSCSRHIKELKDALDLDQWKSLAQLPMKSSEQFPLAAQTLNGSTQGSKKRSPEVVVYENPRNRKKIVTAPVVTVKSGWKAKPEKSSNQRVGNEFNLRKAQHEVQKLAISGMNKLEKEEAKIALAIKLGAKPPKNKYYNYRELLALKKQEQQASEASLLLDKKKVSVNHRGGKKRQKDKNDVRAFDSQVGRFRDGVQMIKKNDLFRMKKARRKTRTVF